tara:strand:+ start:181 stop:462 length:282 start_codon:yes stop_codon:yes gene_type:complete
MVNKKQKVRFHKGDKRPGNMLGKNKLSYTVDMVKEGRKILWHVIEEPTGNVVGKYFFEEDAKALADFQNKNKVWQINGGIPKFLWNWSAVLQK